MAQNPTARLDITAENRTKPAFDAVRRSMRDVEGATSSLHNTLAGLGVGLSLGGLAAFIKGTINSQDELSKLSQRVGVSVESLSALNYAAGLSDVSLDSLATGLKKLSVNMADTQANTGEARYAFRALNIDVEASRGALKSSEQVLLEIADRFAGMEDGAGKTALAVKIFGRAGADLIPLLNQGSRGLRENAEEARRFGLVISTEAAKKAEEFNDNLRRISESLRGFGIAIGNEALPWLNKMVEQLLAGTRIAGGFANALRLFGLSSITSDNAGAKINEIIADIEKLQQARARAIEQGRTSGKLIPNFDAEIADKKKQLEFARFLQSQAALELGKAAGGDTPGERARTATPKLPAPKLISEEELAKARAVMAKYRDTLSKLREDAIPEELRGNEFIKIKFAIENDDKLKALAPELKQELLDAAAVVTQIQDIARADKERKEGLDQVAKDVTKQGNDEIAKRAEVRRSIIDLIDPIQKYRDEIAKVEKALEQGDISPAQAAEALLRWNEQIEAAQGLDQELKKTFGDMTQFAIEAARNMQDAMADGFFDLMQGKLSRLDQSFKEVIDRMVANALAAKLADKLFGKDFGKTGELGGVIGNDVIPFLTNLFKADGGPISAGTPYIVGERGPELIIPKSSGTVIPNHALGGSSVNNVSINISLAGPVDRRSAQQIAAQTGLAVQRALARGA